MFLHYKSMKLFMRKLMFALFISPCRNFANSFIPHSCFKNVILILLLLHPQRVERNDGLMIGLRSFLDFFYCIFGRSLCNKCVSAHTQTKTDAYIREYPHHHFKKKRLSHSGLVRRIQVKNKMKSLFSLLAGIKVICSLLV